MRETIAPSYVDLDLSKIKSDFKRSELYAILENINPGHDDRLYLVRFLGYVGYDAQHVCDIIHYGCAWANYSQNMTYNQVMSVFRWLNRVTSSQPHHFNPGERSERGAWIKHDDYKKLYRRPLCAIHAGVHCPDCPDNVNHKCLWVRS